MLEFKGQAHSPAHSDTARNTPRRADWLAEFDFLRALIEFFTAPAWGTQRMELRPVPVRVRNRR